MIGYVVRFISEHSAHPFLAGLFVIGGVFAVAGIVIEQSGGTGVASGFMIVYAMIAVAMGALGYVILLISKNVSRLRRGTSGV